MKTNDDTFPKEFKIVDQWKTATMQEKYRLIERSAGAPELQIKNNGQWKPEASQYIHSVLCERIKQLGRLKTDMRFIPKIAGSCDLSSTMEDANDTLKVKYYG